MKNIIKPLDEDIVRLISAGEVIESPASVIKELVENSIDSGADSISVEIKNGGKTYIRVSDNGSGIEAQYVEEAFKKHSTSKIATLEDFHNIGTNGFRGEALSSIVAVATVTMITKTREQNYGLSITMIDKKIIEKLKVGAQDGTTVTVQNLFENIPARKKFLKSDRAESSQISSYLIKYALAHPEVRFKFINNSKQIFQTYGSGDLLQVACDVLGENFHDKVIKIDEQINEDLKISGIIGNNSAMYSSRKMQYIFVNSRIVRGENLQKAMEEAYKKFIPSGNFPMFLLNISVNPLSVDVNIHPNKLEVKFENEKEVFANIKDRISRILDNSVMIPTVKKDSKPAVNVNDYETMFKIEQSYEKFKKDKVAKSEINPDCTNENYVKESSEKYCKFETNSPSNYKKHAKNEPEKSTDTKINTEAYTKKVIKKSEETVQSPFIIPKEPKPNTDKTDEPYFVDLTLLRYVGRVFDTYIILHDDKHMYMIDQHAAHERVLFERFMSDFKKQRTSSQGLLLPKKLSLPINLTDYSQKIVEILYKFGYECELFGDNILLIRSVPVYFSENQSELFVQRVFDVFLDEDHYSYDDVIVDKIATKACKAAIKGSDTGTKDEEVEKLLYDLEHCENKYACPHGRPTITRLSRYEIEKFFKRIL